MKLAIFDIDGTLTNTSQVDALCFKRALAELYAITEIGPEWESSPHHTDSGITHHIFRRRLGRAPSEEELSRFKHYFVELLRQYQRSDPAFFAEIPGAAAMLDLLGRESDWAVALATGCWQLSARMKLEAAGLRMEDVPAGFAEDGLAREEIVQATVARAMDFHHQTGFEKIVSIGDGLWDVRAAARLNLSFIGVAVGERAQALRQAGAQHILADFSDYERFVEYLHEAAVP